MDFFVAKGPRVFKRPHIKGTITQFQPQSSKAVSSFFMIPKKEFNFVSRNPIKHNINIPRTCRCTVKHQVAQETANNVSRTTFHFKPLEHVSQFNSPLLVLQILSHPKAENLFML